MASSAAIATEFGYTPTECPATQGVGGHCAGEGPSAYVWRRKAGGIAPRTRQGWRGRSPSVDAATASAPSFSRASILAALWACIAPLQAPGVKARIDGALGSLTHAIADNEPRCREMR